MSTYAKADLTHNSLDSSDGLQTTSGADESITLASGIVWISMYNGGTSAYTIVVNGGAKVHYVPAGGGWNSGKMKIDSIVIKESGSQYAYSAGVVS